MSTAVMEVTAVLSKEADGDDLPRIELQENNWPVLLLQTINTYRVDGTACDVVLVSEEGSTLKAHSLVLKAASPYFKQVLESADTTQSKIVMQISSPERTLAQILDFLYTGKVVTQIADIQSLRQLTQFFGISTLQSLCDQCGFGLEEESVVETKNEDVEPTREELQSRENEATRKSAVSQETREDGFQGNTVPYTHVEDHTQHVSAEDTQVLVTQSAEGEIHVIQQEDRVSGQEQQEGEESHSTEATAGGVDQVILDIPIDMLPLEIQPQGLPPKTKPFKIYRYKCGYCDKTFSHKYRLKGHQATAHFGRKAHKCQLCDKSYTQLEYLRDHMATHSAEKRFECRICNKKFQTMRVMKKHEKTHTYRLEEKFKCDLCSKVLSSKTHLQKHLVSHTGVKNYKCSECDKSFMYAEGLLKHKQLHELGNMRKCSTCKQHFGTPKELKEHTLTEHPSKPKQHQCDICGRSFAAEGWLNKHVMDVHGEDGKQTFKCLVCGVDFPRESLLQIHREAAHAHDASREAEMEEESSPSAGEKNCVYPCQQCHKIFKRKFALKEHVRTHTGEKPHVCQYCSKAYTSSSNLRKHERAIHDAQTLKSMLAGTQADRDVLVEIYKCGVCTQTFGELEDLQDHVTQHKKDLTCTKCRKIFMSKEKFEEHVAEVHNRVKFVCDVCNKVFSAQRHLAAHLMKLHDINGSELRQKMLQAIQLHEKSAPKKTDTDSERRDDAKKDRDGAGGSEVTETVDEGNMHVLHVKDISEEGLIVLESSTGEAIDSKDFEMATLSVNDEQLPVVLVSNNE